jgi:hypothetical protein
VTDFHLRHLVRDVLATSTLTTPKDIAEEVRRRIKPGQRDQALAQCLPEYVREEVTRQRTITTGATERSGAGGEVARPGGRARSAKVAAVRGYWQSQLRQRIHIGRGEWRMLGDCTFTDLMYAAQERRQHAERNLAAAEEFERYAQAVQAHRVERLRDLPGAALADLKAAAA